MSSDTTLVGLLPTSLRPAWALDLATRCAPRPQSLSKHPTLEKPTQRAGGLFDWSG